MSEGTCSVCGNGFDANYIEPTRSEMLEKRLCFGCHYWSELVRRREEKDIVRVNGHHYVVEPDTPKERRRWAGFGGEEFRIRWHDGRETVTHNLWMQGKIPELWRKQLPDNAEFVKGQ